MRFSITELFGGDCNPATAKSPAQNAPLQYSDLGLDPLLQTFAEQSAQIRSIVAIRCDEIFAIARKDLSGAASVGGDREAVMLRVVTDEHSCPSPLTEEPIRPIGRSLGTERACALDGLARRAGELSGSASGEDLLLLPADELNKLITPVADDFSFRALAVLLPQSHSRHGNGDNWRLRRALFDRGLVCISSVRIAGATALCFLASDAVRFFDTLDVESRGYVAMSGLTEYGAFGNQLFRYACAKLYALRHSLTPAFPAWQGRQLFGLEDEICEGITLPQLSYGGFAENDREFWYADDPPINIDLAGYFQEIPECWRRHRPLLRHIFDLVPLRRQIIEAWHRDVTADGRRTLVAVHIRRGDYRNLQTGTHPWFRLVPEDWYIDWLRTIWPTLREPLLFIGTDEPDSVLPWFREFETISPKALPVARALPDHVRDFEILRRADYLAICNSSFSRMASILAPDSQKCFLPSFETQCFEPYEPWIDPAFWARFADSWRRTNMRGKLLEQPASAANHTNGFNAPSEQATIFFDVSDLLGYLQHHTTLSGIQRVQCEILRHLLDILPDQPVRFAVLNKRRILCAVETSELLDVIEDVRSGKGARPQIDSDVRALLVRADPCTVRQGDIFLSVGGFWNVSGMGMLLRDLKNSGAVIGVFIHDLMPLAAPEYFETPSTAIFVKAVVEALTFADFILTTSKYNEATLAEHMAAAKLDPLPIRVVPLGHELLTPTESKISKMVAELIDKDFVLCVGTLEVRKNPGYLFNIWKMMVRSGRPNIPTLVFVGREGWLVQDFIDQLKACNYLAGKIVVLHNVTDVELQWLYQRCMLTMFPSLLEGWGLPVGESLTYGKICLCSDAGGIPEVGGKLSDYIDPYNPRDGLQKLLRYLDDPELRRARERDIADNFRPRSWRQVAEDFLNSTQALSSHARPLEGHASIFLPQSRYLPISSDAPATLMEQMDGRLSAELVCVSGWHPSESSGVRAAEPSAMIRFRADAPVGTRINLALKLAANGRDFRVRICSGSGTETEASVVTGSERLAVLSCKVEPGELVRAHLSSIGATLAGDQFRSDCYWMLKGILYFAPERVTGGALNGLNGKHETQDPSSGPPSPPLVDRREHERGRVLLRPATMDQSWRAPSFGTFLQATDFCWPVEFTTHRAPPLFADHADRRAFYSGCENDAHAPQVGRITDCIRLVKRSNQFVSTSRFSEGSVFDRLGVWKAFGYLRSAHPEHMPWLLREPDGLFVEKELLAKAPFYEGRYLVFYNGNLHNYYHWLVEGLLPLDILTQALGVDTTLKIALPKSVDINALVDHRESLRAIGFAGYDIVEVAADLIRVREAVWVDSDNVMNMPASYLRDFRQRVAALYAGPKHSRGRRRLFVARKGPSRKVHNLEQVQDVLSRYDFETVYLEGMSTADQITLFQSAEFIIGPHGAGLSNLLFCEPGTKVIEFMPSVEMRTFFWLISTKLDLVHGMQFCATVEAQDFQSSITVDIGKLQTLIRKVDAHSQQLAENRLKQDIHAML